MSHFSVSFDRREGPPEAPVRVLELRGELDAHTAPDFEAALQACLDDGDARLVADGAGLDYVSSAANRTLLYVPGNHDPDLKTRPLPMYTDSDFSLAWKEPPGPPGGVNLDGSFE